MLRNRLFIEWCITLLAAAGIACWASLGGLTARIDDQLQDLAVSWTVSDADERVVLVEIDDRSLQEIGPWPWSRALHADLIARLSAAGAKVIVPDVLFLEPGSAADDAALAAALGTARNVILPFTFGPQENSVDGRVPLMPLEILQQVAGGMGHVTLQFDSDGIIRHVPLVIAEQGVTYPHLMQVTQRFIGEEPADAGVAPQILPFHPAGSYSSIPASHVLQGAVPADFLRDQIVLIGATAPGLQDRYAVPSYAGHMMSGIEIQANLLDALLHDRFVRHVPAVPAALLSIAIVLALMAGFWAFSPKAALGLTGALAIGTVVLSLALPVMAGLWFAPGAALAGIIIAYPLWGWRRLVSVVDFLRQQTVSLGQKSTGKGEGFDPVDRQMHEFQGLLVTVQENFAFVRRVIDAAPEPMVVMNPSGDVIAFNDAACRLFGPFEIGTALTSLIAGCGGRMTDDERELILDDGRSFRVVHARVGEDGSGQLGVIVQFHEISVIRQAEQERRQTLEFLSHDMRSPQAIIIAMTQDNAFAPDDAARLQRIRQQAERTLQLADNFVQLARLQELPLRLEDCDLRALLIEAAERAFFSARDKKIAIVQDENDEPVFACCDAAMISRMLDNLLGNAIRYCPAGSTVRLSLDTADASGDQSGEHVKLIVSDNGPGLPAARRADPFARFGASQDHGVPSARALSGNGPSSGLGLTFVAAVVRRHQGRITVDSEEGQGTAFHVLLPVDKP